MEINYALILMLLCCLFLGINVTAQTYTINSSGFDICAANTGIDETFACAFDNAEDSIALGGFIDTNVTGFQLSSMTLVIYAPCSGAREFYMNGVSIVIDTTVSGLTHNCEAIVSDPNITQTIEIMPTSELISAYAIGDTNTLSVRVYNSEINAAQCFYGADIMVTSIPVGIEELGNSAVRIFPNPTIGTLRLKGGPVDRLELFDKYGRLLSVVNHPGSIFDISDFPTGVYFLKVQIDGGLYSTKVLKL